MAGSCAFVRTRIAIAPCCGPGPRERPDRGGDPGQLGLVGRKSADLGPRSRVVARDQAFRRPRRDAGEPLVGGGSAGRQDAVRQRQDLGRRAVVGLEPHDPRVRVALLEADQVVAGGAGERVDRLVLVADDREVLPPAEPRVEERRLERVRVLVLVDREPAIAVAHLGRDRVVGLDEPDRQLEHVLEVDPAGARLGGLVAAVEGGHQVRREGRIAVVVDGPRLVVVRADPARLGPLDLARQVPHGEEPVAARQPGRERGEDRHLRLEDRRRVAAVDARPEVAELTERGGMERGGRDARLAERRQPRPHLAGGLVGERDDQDVAWPDHAGGERVADASRDDPRLAAARAGQDAQRAGRDEDGLALGRIEVGQEVVGVAARHPAIVVGRAASAVIGTRVVLPGADAAVMLDLGRPEPPRLLMPMDGISPAGGRRPPPVI